MSLQEKFAALDYIRASIENIHYNCTPYNVAFLESPSIRRTLMPKAWSDHRMADENRAAYERHPQVFDTVDRPSEAGSPNLLIRNASLDAEYTKPRSTVFIPIDGKAFARIGSAEFTFVLVEKWVAERIKNAREFLPPQYIVLYPEVMEIVPDFDRNTVTMNIFALGIIDSPHDNHATANFATIKHIGCPFFFGFESVYDARFNICQTHEVRKYRAHPWMMTNDDNDDEDKPSYISVNQRKKRALKQDDDNEN